MSRSPFAPSHSTTYRFPLCTTLLMLIAAIGAGMNGRYGSLGGFLLIALGFGLWALSNYRADKTRNAAEARRRASKHAMPHVRYRKPPPAHHARKMRV